MVSRGDQGEGEGCCWRAGRGLESSAPRNGGRVLAGKGRWFGMKRKEENQFPARTALHVGSFSGKVTPHFSNMNTHANARLDTHFTGTFARLSSRLTTAPRVAAEKALVQPLTSHKSLRVAEVEDRCPSCDQGHMDSEHPSL